MLKQACEQRLHRHSTVILDLIDGCTKLLNIHSVCVAKRLIFIFSVWMVLELQRKRENQKYKFCTQFLFIHNSVFCECDKRRVYTFTVNIILKDEYEFKVHDKHLGSLLKPLQGILYPIYVHNTCTAVRKRDSFRCILIRWLWLLFGNVLTQSE